MSIAEQANAKIMSKIGRTTGKRSGVIKHYVFKRNQAKSAMLAITVQAMKSKKSAVAASG
jgi:hypothetical protein